MPGVNGIQWEWLTMAQVCHRVDTNHIAKVVWAIKGNYCQHFNKCSAMEDLVATPGAVIIWPRSNLSNFIGRMWQRSSVDLLGLPVEWDMAINSQSVHGGGTMTYQSLHNQRSSGRGHDGGGDGGGDRDQKPPIADATKAAAWRTKHPDRYIANPSTRGHRPTSRISLGRCTTSSTPH